MRPVSEAVIHVYRDAVHRGLGPISPSCGMLLWILAYSLACLRERINIVDVGAGGGVSTLFLASAIEASGENGRVVSVERDRRMASVLRNNLWHTGLGELVEVVEADFTDVYRGLGRADLVFVDVGRVPSPELVRAACEVAGETGILAFHDAVSYPERGIAVRRVLDEAGYVYSVLPVDTGVLLSSQGYLDKGFYDVASALYRESLARGAYPVSANTARLLYVLCRAVTASSAYRVVEVGSGCGFSSLWLAAASRGTASTLYCFEPVHARLAPLRRALGMLGMDAEMVCGWFEDRTVRLGNVAMLFIDARKEDYETYLEASGEMLVRGALIVAHNTVSSAAVEGYLRVVHGGGNYASITTMPDPGGVTTSVRL